MWIVSVTETVVISALSRGVGGAGGVVVAAAWGTERQPWPWQMAGWSARCWILGGAVDVAMMVMGEGRSWLMEWGRRRMLRVWLSSC